MIDGKLLDLIIGNMRDIRQEMKDLDIKVDEMGDQLNAKIDMLLIAKAKSETKFEIGHLVLTGVCIIVFEVGKMLLGKLF